VLAQSDITKSFDVYYDASGTWLGCVLMQDGCVIAYSSWQLRCQEEQYPTHDLELNTVVLAPRTWRHYILGNVVHIFTEHKSLKYIFIEADLNMRQRRWLELIKDYDLEVHYHPSKVNVFADVLSRKAHCNYLPAISITREKSNVWVPPDMAQYNVTLTPLLGGEIIVAQSGDEGVAHIKRRLAEGDPKVDCFHVDEEGYLCFLDRQVVPKDHELRKKIFDEAHTSKYSIHPASQRCIMIWRHNSGRRFKADHMRPIRLLQPLNISAWKWKDISMDFIVGLPLSTHKFDSIWVIMDWFTKSAHFIPVHTNYRVEKCAELYIARILCLHGVPKTIISSRGPQFVSRFWEQLHASLGTHLIHSSTYHPQTDGQTERVNQILEHMFRACVLNYHDK
jgi:hypothetical protein